MQPPPKDENNCVIPHNHPEIEDGDEVVRRISPHYLKKLPDGSWRLSSLAFEPSSRGSKSMSVDIPKLIRENDIDVIDYVTSPPYLGAVNLAVGYLRELELMVGYEPVEDNPYHGGVWGNFTTGKKRKLARQANFLKRPAQLE